MRCAACGYWDGQGNPIDDPAAAGVVASLFKCDKPFARLNCMVNAEPLLEDGRIPLNAVLLVKLFACPNCGTVRIEV